MSIALIGGPTGVGKTSIVEALLKLDSKFVRPAAYTTRPARPEDNEYQFTHVTNVEMEQLSLAGKLLSLDEVHGHLYALSKDSIEHLASQNKVVIKEFFLRDHHSVRDFYPDTLSVVIMPLSAETLTAHIRANSMVKTRAQTRGDTEFSEHAQLLESHPADIIIYNNFVASIDELAKKLGQEITTLLST